jgi:hypothetical protein
MAVKDVKELTVYVKAYSVEFGGRQDGTIHARTKFLTPSA